MALKESECTWNIVTTLAQASKLTKKRRSKAIDLMLKIEFWVILLLIVV